MATVAALSAAVLVSAPAAQANEADSATGSRFTLAVLPDTQFYSRYAQSNFVPAYGTDPFSTQTKWIVDHAAELNIPFTSHVGDVVDQVGKSGQWDVADAAMRTLESAGAPYSILAGNHDVLDSSDSRVDTDYDLAAEPYLQHFTPQRAAAQPTEGGTDATGMNQYQIFEAEGQKFMSLSLSWRVSDASLAWANGVIAANPTLPVILTSHDIISVDGEGNGVTSPNGERLWQKLIADNDQIFLTLNGHYHGAAHIERTNNAGHPVTQILMDYQMAYEGGNGYMSLLEFDLSGGAINVSTVSPWVAQKSAEQLTSYDEPVLTGPGEDFTIDLDFTDRFRGFTSTFRPGTGAYPSLAERAKSIVTEGFPGVPSTTLEKSGSSDDYVEVDGTLAHWQMTGPEGTLAPGATITDIAGDNDLHRATAQESGSASAQPEDARLTSDSHAYSPSAGSVCFDNSDKRDNRLSYLTTSADAAVNDADLSTGYTIETFVKMNADWSTDANAWSKALVRSGNRSQIPGMPWSQWDYTASPAALGISNLREFQWTEIGSDATKGDKTNWSGEIMVDTWAHVALVNDPATSDTVMYVDGAPVLRTAQGTVGMSFNQGMAWLLGSDWVDDHATNGWNGCIGETRIVDHPLERSQWLTAREDISTLAVAAPAPVAADAESATLTGTGTPRATVTVSGAGADVTATVDAQGAWSATVPAQGISTQGTELTAVQGFGSRLATPISVTLTRETAPVPTPDPTETPAPTESGTPAPTGTTAPSATATETVIPAPATDAAGADSSLARTGGVADAWLIGLAALLLAAGAVTVLLRRRRDSDV